MSCQHEHNRINIFELPVDEEYGNGTDTGDELQQDREPTKRCSHPTPMGKRSKSSIHNAPDEVAENTHSQHFSGDD